MAMLNICQEVSAAGTLAIKPKWPPESKPHLTSVGALLRADQQHAKSL